MTISLAKDLNTVRALLPTITDHNVEYVERHDEVYVNFGHAEAVCIGRADDSPTHGWYAEALAWDRTGGVSEEKWLGEGTLENVLAKVAEFLTWYDAATDI